MSDGTQVLVRVCKVSMLIAPVLSRSQRWLSEASPFPLVVLWHTYEHTHQ